MTAQEKTDAINAINTLKFKFLEPKYFGIPDVEKFLTQPFVMNDLDTSHSDKAGKYTQFDSITFSEQKYTEGSLKIKVKVVNYIKNYGTSGFSIDDQEKTFTITNVLGQLLQPG